MCQNVQIQLHIVCMTLTLTLLIHNLWLVEGSCTFKGEEVCEGKIVKETKKSARICIDGKVLKKKKEEIKPWPGYGGSCMWYGEVLCDGAEVQVGFSDCIPFIYINLGSVPMVVSGEMFQVQDVCKEQILVRRHLGQEIQS